MTDFDLRIISLGAGVQSSALYRLAVLGEVGPKPDYAIFADTQCEPPWVYENLAELEAWGDIPILRPSAGSLGDKISKAVGNQEGHFANIPFWTRSKDGASAAPLRRHCTSEFKINVVKRQVRDILGLEPGQRAAGKFRVEEWVGISIDEVQRAKPSRFSWVTTRWPLLYDIPMRRPEIKDWMRRKGFKIPGKSACTFCPYRQPVEYARWRAEEPELFEEACEWDELLRSGETGLLKGMRDEAYIWRDLRPLRELPPLEELEKRDDRQINLFENECEGMCGV